jgi:hypothetical protein
MEMLRNEVGGWGLLVTRIALPPTEPRASRLHAIIMPPGASNLCARFRDFQKRPILPTWTRRYVANVA